MKGSPSLIALYQWVLDTLQYSPFSRDWHSLADATILATGSSIPCYSKALPPSSALRCCVGHLHRILVNDKFPGWEEMGKFNFVSRVEDGDDAANRILMECVKGAYLKTHYKGAKGTRSKTTEGYGHDNLMEIMIEREREMEIALKMTRSRGYPLSPEVSERLRCRRKRERVEGSRAP